MKIAIIGAMDKEVELISKALENKKILNILNYKFEIGNLFNHEVILTVSSIGKVATGMLMGVLFSNFSNIDKIINIGVAGGVKGKINPGDVMVSEKLSYSDADARGFGYEYGQIPRCPLYYYGDETMIKVVDADIKKGTILTADVFQTNEEDVKNVIESYFKNDNVLCLDMESTAFAQCSFKQNIGFLAIRAVSDVIGADDQTTKYENTLEIACSKAHDVLMDILQKI